MVYPWRGHVLVGDETIVQDTKHRPQDLRVLGFAAQQASSAPVQTEASRSLPEAEDSDDDAALLDLVLETEQCIATQGARVSRVYMMHGKCCPGAVLRPVAP
jgi:hypothetical protein